MRPQIHFHGVAVGEGSTVLGPGGSAGEAPAPESTLRTQAFRATPQIEAPLGTHPLTYPHPAPPLARALSKVLPAPDLRTSKV